MSTQTRSLPADAPPVATTQIISYDAATGEEIGRVPQTSAGEVKEAVAVARRAQVVWARQSFPQRAKIILRAREIILDELDQIAILISRETGKPVAEAISMELVPTLDLMYYFAGHTAKLL